MSQKREINGVMMKKVRWSTRSRKSKSRKWVSKWVPITPTKNAG